jgi:hypothetical protein
MGTVVAVEARFRQTAAHVHILARRRRPVSICGLRGLLRLGDRGQRLIVCPVLEAALEFFRRRQCCAPWMPNDPYDLAHAPAPTASCRRPTGRGEAVAVSAAALTDHVCDRWHGRAASRASSSRLGEAHSRLRSENRGICIDPCLGGGSPATCAAQPDRRVGRLLRNSESGLGRRMADKKDDDGTTERPTYGPDVLAA